MKKKLIAGVMIVGLIGASLAGCSKETKEISNDNIIISQYKGLEVDKVEVTEVTDEDVENDIQSTLENNKIYSEVTDRSAEDGDRVTIDYVGKVDGVAFENGSAEGEQLEIGNNSYIEGFDAGIIGHSTGETFDIDVTFPDPYTNNSDLSGKAAVFTITLRKIESASLPELNDEFVASVTEEESTTVEEYKEEVKKTLQENNENTAVSNLQSAVYTKLMEYIEVIKYPEDELEEAIELTRSNHEQEASYYSMELSEYIELAGMTEDEYDTQLKESAKTTVKFQQALKLIAEKEKLTPTEKEYQEKYEEYADTYGYESTDALIEAATEDTLQQMVLQEVVMDWLVDNCKQVEPTEDEDTTDTTGQTEETTEEDSAEE